MASKSGLFFLLATIAFQLNAFPAIQPSAVDSWDVSSGVRVRASSGMLHGLDVPSAFGAETGPGLERGHAIFQDGLPDGYIHFVEWETPQPLRLTRVHLFASGDGPEYANEREFDRFILKAKRNISDAYQEIFNYTPAHPYTFIDSTNRALLAVDVPATDAQYFRAEFIQRDAGRGFDGPRVIELDGFGTLLQRPRGPVADWTFEEGVAGQGATTVLDSSGHGHVGEVSGSAFFRRSQLPGLPGNGYTALELSGGGHFAPTNSDAFNFRDEDFTLEAILNPGSGNTGPNRGIIVAQNPSHGALAYVLDYSGAHRTVNFALVAADGFNEFVTAVIPNDGNSHHVAAIRNGSTLSIHLDGRHVHSRNISVVPNLPRSGPVALRVGASSAGFWFDGTLDRVRISRGALESAEFIRFQPAPLAILQQPQSQTVNLGAPATFSVVVSSNLVPAYQWYFNGSAIFGATNAFLSFSNAQLSDTGRYHVEVSAFGQVLISDSAFLSIMPLPASGESHDDLFDVSEGSQVIRHSGLFPTIRAAGAFGDEGPSVETGSTIFADDRPEGFTHYIEWRTASPINLRRLQVFAAGDGPAYLNEREFQSFTLKVKSSESSATFDRTVYSYTATHPYSFVNPTNLLLIDAELLGVAAQDFRAEFVQWNSGRRFDGPRILEIDGFGERLAVLSPHVADWTFEEGTPGERVLRALDSSGNGHHLDSVSGGTARFTLTPSGPGHVSVDLPPVSGGIGNALRAGDSLAFNLGTEFTIEANFEAGAQNTEFNRGVVVGQDAATGRLVYALDYRSEDRAVHFLIADAQGRSDAVEARLPDDSAFHHIAGVFSGGILRIYLDKSLAASKATTILPGITPGGAGRVTLGANDIGGFWFHGTLDRVRISRQALAPEEFFPHVAQPGNPLVVVQPLQDATVPEGGAATFRIVAAGGTNLAYRWSFNGQTLSNQLSDTLVLSNVRLADAGTYTVTVSSAPWEISSSAVLAVTGAGTNPPVIVSQPVSRLAGVDLFAQFSVTATSSTPLSYQWFFNGAALPGETNNTFMIFSVAPEHAGTYYVTVRNASGIVTSLPAILNTFSSTLTGGTVFLDNRRPGVDAPVTDDRGLRLSGLEFLAQLYGAPAGQPLAPIGAAIPFGTGENAGYFSDPIERIIPGTNPGDPARMEVRAWDSRSGRTYEEAVANGGLHGISNPIADTLGGGGALPATLTTLQPFPLGSRPKITQQPQPVSVLAGGTAVFQVEASGSTPLTYQWRFNRSELLGQTNVLLVLSNVTELDGGDYSVDVVNELGMASSQPARLTVLPRDTQPPLVTLISPLPGITTNARVTLAGAVSDNGAVTRVEWLRNGQFVGPIPVTNGSFVVPNVLLAAGTNTLMVIAFDDHGNLGSAAVSTVLESQRSLYIGATTPVHEGQQALVPIQLSSSGDIGALSFSISYDTNYFMEPILDFVAVQGAPFTQVNLDQPGLVRATYVLPGRTVRPGTQHFANLRLRARSVPETLASPVILDLQGVYSATGDAILTGTTVASGELVVNRRKIVGDNNANDRLDISDASIMIRMLTQLEPTRPWDVTGNDLNQNGSLDAGDIVRVLRAVVNLDPQPRVPDPGFIAQAAQEPAAGADLLAMVADKTRLVPGEKITVRLVLDENEFDIHGASFQVEYPTNALRLDNEEAHSIGPIVSSSAMSLWNVFPGQDYASQDGRVSFATSSASAWSTNAGVLAEFIFTVQPGATAEHFWPIRLHTAEISTGLDLAALNVSELLLEGRPALSPTLTAGAFDLENDVFELRLAGEPGARYRIETSEDLRSWTEIGVFEAETGELIFTDAILNGPARRFYRAQEVD